jgi:hypothetical protein
VRLLALAVTGLAARAARRGATRETLRVADLEIDAVRRVVRRSGRITDPP